MRSALLVCTGSRGDTEPVMVLAQSLLASRTVEKVHIALHEEYLPLVPKSDAILAHVLPYSLNDMLLKYANVMQHGIPDDLMELSIPFLAVLVKDLAVPALPFIIDIAKSHEVDVVLTTTLMSVVCMSIGSAMKIPAVILHFQPNVPTRCYPYHLTSTQCTMQTAQLGQKMVVNKQHRSHHFYHTYTRAFDRIHIAALPNLNEYHSKLQIPAITAADIQSAMAGTKESVTVITSYPTKLLPRSPDLPTSVQTLPPFISRSLPDGWDSSKFCPKLHEYFKTTNAKPFVITFGSMSPDLFPQSLFQKLFTALYKLSVTPVVVLKGQSQITAETIFTAEDNIPVSQDTGTSFPEWFEQSVTILDEQPPYAWLFPQCRGVLCHGGAGTISAAVHASVPLVICPIAFDQLLWAPCVESVGIGAFVKPSGREATQQAFENAISKALSTEVVTNAARVGSLVRDERDGTDVASEIIADLLRR